ncbi:MAG: undecaprenyldiphospho-muramoylpentapeptide beta-N-acetylglucosaminyltransferase [Armatimonadota bacterium]
MKSKNIFVTGGGTGGHLYPAMVVGKALKAQGYNVIYIGSGWGVESKIIPEQTDFKFFKIRVQGLRGSIIDKFFAFVYLFISIIKMFFLTLIYNPVFVVGTGGYVSAPVVIAGFLCGRNVFLLEQNYLPGKTTKFLAHFSKKIFVSFPETLKKLDPSKGVFTGNPVREDILKYSKDEAREKLNLDKDKTTILITGASQGARSINKAVVNALEGWKNNNWQIIHLTGDKNYDYVVSKTKDALESSVLKYIPLAYMEDICLAYAAADIAICRTGATTIAELTLKGLPSVLIPYPYAAENHQYYNALFLEKNGAGVIIEDKNLDKEFIKKVENIILNKDKLEQMSKNALRLGNPHALDNIVSEIKKLREDGDKNVKSCGS